MTTYNYTISGNFPSGIDSFYLERTITESNIVPTLTNITTKGDNVYITFSSSLSGPEVTTLNNIISAHTTTYNSGKCLYVIDDFELLTTNSTNYTTKTTLSTIYLTAGLYIITFSYQYKYDATAIDVLIDIDDTIEVNHTYDSRIIGPNDMLTNSGLRNIILTEGFHTLKIKMKSVNGSCSLWNCSLLMTPGSFL